MRKFSIIVPTLNEVDNIIPLLQRIEAVARISDISPEIFFIDDGSTDGTCEQITAYDGELTVKLHQRKGVKGLAGAVITGARLAQYEDLVIMDCDLSHPPESILALIQPLLSDNMDMVIGSRYTPGGSTPDWPFLRKLSSRLATLPAHFLTGVEDPLAGFFSIKKKFLAELDPSTDGFKIGFELLCTYGDDIRSAEVPIRFTDRSHGKSKMRLSILVHYFFQLLKGYGVNYKIAQHPLLLLIGCFAALTQTVVLSVMLEAEVSLRVSHIASFFISMHATFALGIWSVRAIEKGHSPPSLPRCYLHLLFLIMPMLFLGSGVITALQSLHVSQTTLLVMMSAVSFITWMLFGVTLKSGVKDSRTGVLQRSLAVAIIFYSLLLRLIYLGTTELLQEEAYYWNYAQHMAPGYLDHPPLVAVLIWLGTNIFGDTEFGVRLGSYLCWFFTAYFTYAMARKMFNAKTAINAVLLVAMLPIFFGSAFVMTPDAPLMTCWAATLYFLYLAMCKNKKYAWIWAGVFFGFGLLSKYTIIFLAPAALIFMLTDHEARRWLRGPWPYFATIISLAIFSPVILWNFENNWASFLFQSHTRIMDEQVFSTHKMLVSVILLLTPMGLLAVVSLLPFFKRWGIKIENNGRELERSKLNRFCLIMCLTPLLVFLFFSLTKEVKLNWTGPIWLVTIPFMAHSILAYTTKNKKQENRLFRVGWQATFLVLILIYGAGFYYLSLGLPGIPYPSNNILTGWDDLYRQVDEIADTFDKQNGRRPVVVGMDKYRIASGISFYKSRNCDNSKHVGKDVCPQVTGRHLFGFSSLMFRYWHPSSLFSHQDILALSTSKFGIHDDYFVNKGMHVGDIKELHVHKNGKNVAKFYYRFVGSYAPGVPEHVVVSPNKIFYTQKN